MLKELILKSRSIRRFYQNKRIDKAILRQIIDNTRNTASARNIQPLKYSAIVSEEMCEKVFSTLGWAGYLENGTPIEGERPTGYIVIYNDKSIAPNSLWDQGIVTQTISLCLSELDLGCCIIASINREDFKTQIPHCDNLDVALIVAIGYPKEEVVITEMENNDFKYFRDAEGIHYVPKRSYSEVYIELE